MAAAQKGMGDWGSARFGAEGFGPDRLRPSQEGTAAARPRALVGREREVATLRGFLREARERFAVLLLEGEEGVGKTALWREAVQLGDEAAFRVLSCQPVQAEAKLAYACLADLMAPLNEETFSGLPEPQRLALEVALLRAIPRDARSDPRGAATALLSVLNHLVATSPLLIAIDDVQWLDRPSATALSFALRRFDPERPLGLLVAKRIEPGRASDVLGLGQLRPAWSERIRLGRLKLSALYHILKEELDLVLPRPTLQRIEQESGGNPLFALELARALKDSGARPGPGEPLPIPSGLAELVASRVTKLPASAREALLAAALSSHPTSGLVERVLGGSAADALERAWRAGLIEAPDERIRFRHPLYASAVSLSALPGKRRALHRRLAELVEDPEERARHLALATRGTDEGVAQILEQGAAMARSRGALGTAAELLERARDLTPRECLDEARRRSVAAAEHHVRAGDRAHARRLVEEVLAQPLPRPQRADALRLLAEITHHDENFGEAERLYREALEYADDPRLAGAIDLGLAYVRSSLMDWRSGAVHAYRALERAEASQDEQLVAQALSHCAMLDFLSGRGVDWDKVERSLELEDPEALLPLSGRPSTLAALLLLYVGRHDEARDRLEGLTAAASASGDESDLAFVLLWLSWLETRSGNFVAAASLAGEAASFAALTGSRSMYEWVLSQQAYVHAHRGAIDETRRYCAQASLPVHGSGSLMPGLWIAASLALLELSLGDAEAAWQACEPMTEALERQGISEPVPAFFLPDALEALITLGQLERAEALLSAVECRARELDRAWALATGARCRGLLLAARGDLTGALTALQHALVEHERIQMPFERARTLLAMGTMERRSGQRTGARTTMEQALAEFGRMGAGLWVERTRAELARISIRPREGTVGLTPTEARIAELVARGQTNREIARTLSVSQKTVEAHLTRIYRKLGVASRAALAARVGQPQSGDDLPKP